MELLRLFLNRPGGVGPVEPAEYFFEELFHPGGVHADVRPWVADGAPHETEHLPVAPEGEDLAGPGGADRDAEQAEGLVPVGEGVALASPFGAGLAVPHDEELLAFLPGACEEPGVPHERGDEQGRGDRLPV